MVDVVVKGILNLSIILNTTARDSRSEAMAHPQCWDNLGHRCSADGPSRLTLYTLFTLPYLTIAGQCRGSTLVIFF